MDEGGRDDDRRVEGDVRRYGQRQVGGQ
jgi:hypothetical protein